jgi:hypothetical protein
MQYIRADYGLYMGKAHGLRIIGANYKIFVPDAIVIIPTKLHKEYLKKRTLDVTKVNKIKNDLKKMAKKHNVPIFPSIQEAVDFLENKK